MTNLTNEQRAAIEWAAEKASRDCLIGYRQTLLALLSASKPEVEQGACSKTDMNPDEARDWAWKQVKIGVGTEGWAVGDEGNYFGFFCWGWNSRGQYEMQRETYPAGLARSVPPPDAPAEKMTDRTFEWYRQQQQTLSTILDAFTEAWPSWYHGGVQRLPGLIKTLAGEANAYRGQYFASTRTDASDDSVINPRHALNRVLVYCDGLRASRDATRRDVSADIAEIIGRSNVEPQPGDPLLRAIMDRDAWRNAMVGLCRDPWPTTADEAASHLRARLHPNDPQRSGGDATKVVAYEFIDRATGTASLLEAGEHANLRLARPKDWTGRGLVYASDRNVPEQFTDAPRSVRHSGAQQLKEENQ